MNLQISSEIVCKANGRDFWLLAEKANKDKAKMKKPRPKTQEGTEEKGVEGKGGKGSVTQPTGGCDPWVEMTSKYKIENKN